MGDTLAVEIDGVDVGGVEVAEEERVGPVGGVVTADVLVTGVPVTELTVVAAETVVSAELGVVGAAVVVGGDVVT